MKKNHRALLVRSAHLQQGAVLVVGLIMLLLIAMIGLASVRGTNMQEIMAGNMRDRNLAFQTAESGLRIGEAQVDSLNPASFAGSGLWRDLNIEKAGNPSPVHEWDAEQWETEGNAIESSLPELPVSPRYIIESVFVPPKAIAEASGSCVEVDCVAPKFDFYRVSSRGTGATGTSEVVLQSFTKTIAN